MFDTKLYSGFDALTSREYEELMEEMTMNDFMDEIAQREEELNFAELDKMATSWQMG